MEQDRILVVDDEAVILDLVKASLDTMGFKVTKASSTDMAYGALEVQNFDLIITDLHLGKYDGIDVLHKAKELNPLTQVIIINADHFAYSAIKAFNHGADDYLQKPFTMTELNECVRKNLSNNGYYKPLLNDNSQNLESPAKERLFAGPIID